MKTHKWNDIKDKGMSPERIAASDRLVEEETVAIRLRELREAEGVTQEELARRVIPTPDVVHAHDWQTALVPVFVRHRPDTHSALLPAMRGACHVCEERHDRAVASTRAVSRARERHVLTVVPGAWDLMGKVRLLRSLSGSKVGSGPAMNAFGR